MQRVAHSPSPTDEWLFQVLVGWRDSDLNTIHVRYDASVDLSIA
jgi:hypothetical protein